MNPIQRIETVHPNVAPIVTGYFREIADYATWRTNGTSDYLLMLTLGGAGRVGWRGGEYGVQVHDAVLLRPSVLHDYGTAQGADSWELLWTHFAPRPHWNDYVKWPEVAPGIGVLRLADAPEMYQRIEAALWEMHRLERGGLPRRDDFAMNALEKALLWCDAANPRTAQSRLDPRIVRVMERLRENPAEPFSLNDLARQCPLSVSRLSHLFREQTGMTPGQFLERERITRAKQLLSVTSRSVAAIADELGFASPFYFTSRFKKYVGVSPREFRKKP